MIGGDALQAGMKALQEGRAAEAVVLFQQSLQHEPSNAGAFVNLGVALRACGRNGEAVVALREATRLSPNEPAAWYNLGNALQSDKQLHEAATAFRQAGTIKPDFGPAWFNLANVLRDRGDFMEAIALYRRAITLMPRFARAPFFLARLLSRTGDQAGAVAAAEQSARIDPNDLENQALLARLYLESNRFKDAEERARAVLGRNPADGTVSNILSAALMFQGRLNEAILLLRSRLQAHPTDAAAMCNLGGILNKISQAGEALPMLEESIRLEPGFAVAHANLAGSLNQLNRLEEAIASARKSLELETNCHDGLMQLAYAYLYSGRNPDARATYRKVLEHDVTKLEAWSNLLYCLSYSGEHTPRQVAEEHFAFGRRAEVVGPLPPRNGPHDPNRRLRLGYLSPDFRGHSVALFLEPLLEKHDRDRCEVYCYSNTRTDDAFTVRFRSFASCWRQISGMPDADVAALVRRDEIDVLVDLAGHTADNRLGVFALRPAPVQVSYLGYPNTTGLRRIDYYLTDDIADPPGEHDDCFSERLYRMPRCLLCYRPRPDFPPVSPLPAARAGHITFGSFNNLAKYTASVIETWSQVLRGVPDSRLLLKAKWFKDANTRARFHQFFERHDIGQERVVLADYTPDMNDIDIALDPFPYNGATTTCHALWMGLPVVALIGDSHCSRISLSILSAVGLADLASGSREAYVAKAAELASNRDRLAHLRATMRERISASPIRDEPGFARAVESAYRSMWKEFCER